jgi:hypothetical protein
MSTRKQRQPMRGNVGYARAECLLSSARSFAKLAAIAMAICCSSESPGLYPRAGAPLLLLPLPPPPLVRKGDGAAARLAGTKVRCPPRARSCSSMLSKMAASSISRSLLSSFEPLGGRRLWDPPSVRRIDAALMPLRLYMVSPPPPPPRCSRGDLPPSGVTANGAALSRWFVVYTRCCCWWWWWCCRRTSRIVVLLPVKLPPPPATVREEDAALLCRCW